MQIIFACTSFRLRYDCRYFVFFYTHRFCCFLLHRLLIILYHHNGDIVFSAGKICSIYLDRITESRLQALSDEMTLSRSAILRLLVAQKWTERADQFRTAGYQAIVADITQPRTLANLPAADTVLFAVGFDGRRTIGVTNRV